MIARLWKCRATSIGAQGYGAYFERAVFPHLSTIPGFVEATILRATAEDDIELTVITYWESEAAVRAFAGERFDRAVIEPEARDYLLSGDSTVRHFEVLRR